LGTIASVANIIVEGIVMKEKPNPISHDLKCFVSMAKSSFINLCDHFDEDDPFFLMWLSFST
jgi:hypothetical protein